MAYIGKTVDLQLHLHSSKESFIQAKNLRLNQTESETLLWNELKNRKCYGLKFRRQHPILSFVADFYCHEKRLIVEVDGSVHDNEEAKERDENRTYELERHGIRIIRFTNHEVKHNINEVLNRIKEVSDSIAKL